MTELIWRGQVPPLAAPNRNPPDLNNLDQLSYNQAVAYIEDFPDVAERIYRWGLGKENRWRDTPRFYTPTNVVDWHEDINPEATTFSQQEISDNNNGINFPIDQLVRRDKVQALHALHQAGLWTPTEYNAHGFSYLRQAYQNGAELVFNYIAYHARHDLDFARSHPAVPSLHGAFLSSDLVNHLDWLLEIGEHKLFAVWWKYLDTPPTVLNSEGNEVHLNNHSLVTLCENTTLGLANYIRENNNVSLETVDTSNIRGSVWHLALKNTNSNFIDYLARYADRTRIDLLAGHMESPLQAARTLKRFNHFKKLLSTGADPDEMVKLDLLDLPRPSDKWFKTALGFFRNINPNPGQQVSGGTLIHQVIASLHREITEVQSNPHLSTSQKAGKRRRLKTRAADLIRLVRVGSIQGRPDLTTRDERGKTAIALAREHGYHELYAALEPSPLPNIEIPAVRRRDALMPQLQQPGARIPARGHRYPTRSSRLRGA
ncbi:hypothetical protein ASPVEDRAFT_878653 [Aspergillus versicolor CBS 583.65]|uniref:Uncharacterized protein n=1 Tax=Aspergillus versicolor CBS 583.65 TaxID=1036611 RepID=A0A1L9Q398_ASPVE|nr:uncharacterized protein ASPVEDRAFT_878653 [Aspergillus versicolor CBS 583.65]OJJ08228.1 hypothetical protein ASPVEDRAFT_878653 [Aspergillus versicolor CBS 583.65]